MIVSFRNYELIPRFDNTQWTQLRIYEGHVEAGPWTLIDTLSVPASMNPADPQPMSFTTDNATLPAGSGWYKITFVDGAGNSEDTEPVFNNAATEILATLNDVNAHLDGEVIEATPDNSELVQISVARIVRGYLSAVVDTTTLMSWQTPEATPDIIREIASMLIAAQVYFNEASRTSLLLDQNNFAQVLYTEAMAMLQRIIDGTIVIVGLPVESAMTMGDGDYFPTDATDRAFTVGMIL
jgi:hypothetical protein